MDAATWDRLEHLFFKAIELPESERVQFVDRQCAAHDAPLREEVLALLAAHSAEDTLLDTSPVLSPRVTAEPEMLVAGSRIGVWRIGALIGRGGAGEVYAAARADGGFEQSVVLKRLYREAAPDLARFHAERQILASLDHPGIARLLDGGVAEDGRLYAVIDHVDGVSIVAHCRQRAAGLGERLSLFLQVCEVVAYAHRNLIVHRDLKPSNILVTPEGRVKLLDFGVAKRLDGTASDAADATSAPYTSDYAAPEQLTGSQITTATDVYALGVVLFELLTGDRPWRTDGMPIARIVRQIVHGDPPLMSRAVSLSDAAPVLVARLAGDLDAIVATCLRKDVTDRYPTVEALQRDIEHHLNTEPVAARGRNRMYALGRMVKRHRWAAGAAVLLTASLATGLVATMWQAHRAEVERDVARRAVAGRDAVINELTNLFRNSVPKEGGAPVSARAMLDASAKNVFKEYHLNPPLLGKVVLAVADIYQTIEDVEGEASLLEAYLAAAPANADRESVAQAQAHLASAEVIRGHRPRATELLAQADAFWSSAPAQYPGLRLDCLQTRAMLLREQGDLAGSIAIYKAAIPESVAYAGAVSTRTADLYDALGNTLMFSNRLEESLAAYRTSFDLTVKLGQGDEPAGLVTLANIGLIAYRIGRLHEAETTLKTAMEKQRQRFGDSTSVAIAGGLYGATLTALGRPAEAIVVLRAATALAYQFAGAGNPMGISNADFLIDALTSNGQLGEARDLAKTTLALAERLSGADDPQALSTRRLMARIDLAAGRAAIAEAEFNDVAAAFRRLGPQGEQALARALLGSGEALLMQGKPAEAVTVLRQAVALQEGLKWGDQNWELAVARGRLGEALKLAKAPGGPELLQQAVPVLTSQLGETHPQVLRARRALALPT